MQFNPRIEYHRYRRYLVDLHNLSQNKMVVVYTGFTLTLLTIAFFGLFALKPTITTIASLIQEQQGKKELDRKLQAKINALNAAQTNYHLAEEFFPLIEEALPTEPLVQQLVYQLETLAQNEGLSIMSLGVEPVVLIGETKRQGKEKFEELNTLSFSLLLRGEFNNLSKFISDLEKLRRIAAIDSLTLSQKETEGGKAMILNLSGRVYFLPKDKRVL